MTEGPVAQLVPLTSLTRLPYTGCMRLWLSFIILACLLNCGDGYIESEFDDYDSSASELTYSTDTKIKNAVNKASSGLFYLSESDHPLVWVRSSRRAPAPANVALVRKAFAHVTNSNSMADKPMSSLASETVDFEVFAAKLKPIAGEDADNFEYHRRMTEVLDLLRDNLKNPVVIRLGRTNGSALVGAISVYIVGTLPSGRIGGLFTVSVET